MIPLMIFLIEFVLLIIFSLIQFYFQFPIFSTKNVDEEVKKNTLVSKTRILITPKELKSWIFDHDASLELLRNFNLIFNFERIIRYINARVFATVS